MIQNSTSPNPMLPFSLSMPASGDITHILGRIREDHGASEELINRVYKELRRIAAAQMRRERGNHTLQPTALVHEVYLRFKDSGDAGFKNRAHFFAAAARLMREILVDHARKKKASKRGGEVVTVSIDDVQIGTSESAEELLALNKALERLATISPRRAKIVELRFFGGLSIDEIARILEIVPRTVNRDWQAAREWLRHEVSRQDGTERP